MAFVKFLGIAWPQNAWELLRVSIQDVQAFRDELLAHNAAPKTLTRRISSVSSFFKYLGAAAAELRLPCCSIPALISARCRSCSATSTSRPRRFTTSAAGPRPRAPATCWRFKNSAPLRSKEINV